MAQVRRQRGDELATHEHEHRHAHQRQHGDQVGAHQRLTEPAIQLHRRRGDQAQYAEHHQGGPHAEGQDDLRAAKCADAKGIQHTEHQYETDAQQPRAAGRLCQGIEVFEVHQGHDAGEDGFGGAGEHMHDQVGRQGPGDRKEPAHAAVDVVVHRTGGGQYRRGLGKGGGLGQHHHHGDQHRQGKRAATDAKAHGGGEDHRAGHDQADGAGQRSGKTYRTPVEVCGESVVDRHGGVLEAVFFNVSALCAPLPLIVLPLSAAGFVAACQGLLPGGQSQLPGTQGKDLASHRSP